MRGDRIVVSRDKEIRSLTLKSGDKHTVGWDVDKILTGRFDQFNAIGEFFPLKDGVVLDEIPANIVSSIEYRDKTPIKGVNNG